MKSCFHQYIIFLLASIQNKMSIWNLVCIYPFFLPKLKFTTLSYYIITACKMTWKNPHYAFVGKIIIRYWPGSTWKYTQPVWARSYKPARCQLYFPLLLLTWFSSPPFSDTHTWFLPCTAACRYFFFNAPESYDRNKLQEAKLEFQHWIFVIDIYIYTARKYYRNRNITMNKWQLYSEHSIVYINLPIASK